MKRSGSRSWLACLLALLLMLAGPLASAQAAVEEAVFAGGCFWCMEHDLESLKGVLDAESGYSGGRVDSPPSAQVSSQSTAHRPVAAIRVQIKPLQRFWPAEGYHQNYAETNALKYRYYRWACGRDRRLDALWGARARRSSAWVLAR